MQSEEIVNQLLEFVSETGRLPKSDEPGLKPLIEAAVDTFGSLENALRVAGLLTSDSARAKSITPGRLRRNLTAPASKSKRPRWPYPQEYFLVLLQLRQTQHHGSPTPSGTPTWWERRANNQYVCSSCRKTIEKGETYIGQKKLRPGQRGIYGYRGTYSTDCYHITCLLKSTKARIEENIESASSEIDSIHKEIGEFQRETSIKRDRIETCRGTIRQAKEDYEKAHGLLAKAGKWFETNYTLWSRNREISGLDRGISYIENREIPDRQNRIANLMARINSLQHRLNEIQARIQELVSF